MDRPQYTINPPKTSNLKVTVPAGWYITIAGVSRELHTHVIAISDDIMPGQPNTTYLGSPHGKAPTPLRDPRHSIDCVAITAQSKETNLNLRFYYTKDKSLSKNLTKVAVPKNLCAAINIHEIVKPETAPGTVADYVILMILIDDGQNKASPDHTGSDSAVATIHLVKKAQKKGGEDEDDDDDDYEDDEEDD